MTVLRPGSVAAESRPKDEDGNGGTSVPLGTGILSR